MAELVGSMLTVVMGDNHGTHHEVATHEFLPQSQHILVVGDAQVGTYLVLHDVLCRYHDDNFQLVAQLRKHPQLRVGAETWQHAAGMVVVEEFATQFQIQFSVELRNALTDVLTLYLEVFLVVKSYLHLLSFLIFVCKGTKKN